MNIKNVLVISDYDMGYSFSAMLNGERMSSDDVKKICHLYWELDLQTFCETMFDNYACDILICSDGGIDYIEYEKKRG